MGAAEATDGGRTRPMTHRADDADDAKPEDDDTRESDDELVPEEIAYNHHTAYVAYQAATQGRGADPQEVCKRADVCASAGARTPAAPAPAKTVHVVLMTPGASRARFGRTGRPELPNGDQAHGDDDPGTQTMTVAAVAPQLACMAQGAAIASRRSHAGHRQDRCRLV